MRQTPRRLGRLALALTTLALSAAPAHAEEGEWALSLGPGAWIASTTVGDEEVATVAPTAHLAARYGLDDFWQLGVAVDAGVALSAGHDPAFVGMAHLQAYYFLDVVRWVLWASAGVGALVRGAHPEVLLGAQTGAGVDLSAVVGLGLDYRPARDWSLGLTARYHLVLTDLDRTAPAVVLAVAWTTYLD